MSQAAVTAIVQSPASKPLKRIIFISRSERAQTERAPALSQIALPWDTGEPEVLARELRNIRSRVRKLIWLNPLLGLADYQPATRAMKAALPYVDVFAPAHNLESLLALERHLTRSGA